MKTNGNRITTLCLALIMLVSTAVVTSIAENTETLTSGGFEYEVLDNNAVSITGYTGTATDLSVPKAIDGKSVTEIGMDVFTDCTRLSSITIPSSVTVINVVTFSGCTSLASIKVSSGNSEYSSENGVLFNKAKTKLICYPAGKSETNYAISNSVISIEYCAFSGCTSLASITIPNSVTEIECSSFENCASLTSIKIPNSVTSIGVNAFCSCTSLTSVTIPNSITEIDDFIFFRCTSLASITIPYSVTSIGEYAFCDCTSLTSITIPNSVISIGKCAFRDCTSLASINVSNSNTEYLSENGILFNKAKTNLICYPAGKAEIKYTIPDSVTQISVCAFSDCTNLAGITIQDSVTQIGECAFYGCTNLASITIPNGITSIGFNVFFNCTRLASITIPKSVREIYGSAFEDCTSLKSINVSSDNSVYLSENDVLYNKNKTLLICYPAGKQETNYTISNNVIEIDEQAFDGCTRLASINVSSNNLQYSSENGVLFNKDKTTLICYPAGKEDTNYTISNRVTKIGEDVFKNCTSLASINVCSGNTDYLSENGVLYNKEKTKLICYPAGKEDTNYTISNSVIEIGTRAFSGCTSLTSIKIPDRATHIDPVAFEGCTGLISISIPHSIKYIGDGALGYDFDGERYNKIDNFSIIGYKNSVAEKYAKYNEFKFIKIDHVKTPITLPTAILSPETATKINDLNNDTKY